MIPVPVNNCLYPHFLKVKKDLRKTPYGDEDGTISSTPHDFSYRYLGIRQLRRDPPYRHSYNVRGDYEHLRITNNSESFYFSKVYKLPCGKCYLCRVRRKLMWQVRLCSEAHLHEHVSFLTLTYNDEHLPPNASLRRMDCTLFTKRLRNNISRFVPGAPKIRYIAVGEYGAKTKRPHYHLMIFGISAEALQSILSFTWTFGFFMVENVKSAKNVGNYVAGYLMKQPCSSRDEYKACSLEPHFINISRFVGLKPLLAERDKIRQDGYITWKRQKCAIPRSFQKYFFTEEELSVRSLDFRKEQEDLMEEFVGSVSSKEEANCILGSRTYQRILNGKAKAPCSEKRDAFA